MCISLFLFFLMYGPVHTFKPRRGSDVSDSNHMSGWLERDSPVSTDTVGRHRMISQFHCVGHVLPEHHLCITPLSSVVCQNRTLTSDLKKQTATCWRQLGVLGHVV